MLENFNFFVYLFLYLFKVLSVNFIRRWGISGPAAHKTQEPGLVWEKSDHLHI